MDQAIREALGLHEGATAADAVLAIGKLREARDTALHSAQHPDAALFVPRPDHDAALERIRTFQAGEAARAEAAVHAAVDAGKIAPASRDFHVAAAKASGVEAFAAFARWSPSCR